MPRSAATSPDGKVLLRRAFLRDPETPPRAIAELTRALGKLESGPELTRAGITWGPGDAYYALVYTLKVRGLPRVRLVAFAESAFSLPPEQQEQLKLKPWAALEVRGPAGARLPRSLLEQLGAVLERAGYREVPVKGYAMPTVLFVLDEDEARLTPGEAAPRAPSAPPRARTPGRARRPARPPR